MIQCQPNCKHIFVIKQLKIWWEDISFILNSRAVCFGHVIALVKIDLQQVRVAQYGTTLAGDGDDVRGRSIAPPGDKNPRNQNKDRSCKIYRS